MSKARQLLNILMENTNDKDSLIKEIEQKYKIISKEERESTWDDPTGYPPDDVLHLPSTSININHQSGKLRIVIVPGKTMTGANEESITVKSFVHVSSFDHNYFFDYEIPKDLVDLIKKHNFIPVGKSDGIPTVSNNNNNNNNNPKIQSFIDNHEGMFVDGRDGMFGFLDQLPKDFSHIMDALGEYDGEDPDKEVDDLFVKRTKHFFVSSDPKQSGDFSYSSMFTFLDDLQSSGLSKDDIMGALQ